MTIKLGSSILHVMTKRPRQRAQRQAQLKVRLPEPLRWSLENDARSRGTSMNTEIVRRLAKSFLAQDEVATTIARAVLRGLDDEVVGKIVEIVLRNAAGGIVGALDLEPKPSVGEQLDRVARDIADDLGFKRKTLDPAEQEKIGRLTRQLADALDPDRSDPARPPRKASK